jgi:hypothetical protein
MVSLAAMAVALLGLAAATSWGAAQSSVTVSGPRTAQVGQRVRLHFRGYAASGVHRLRVWLDDRACASTARAEGARIGLRSPTDFSVDGHFRDRLTVEHSAKGTHVVCAYLVHRTSQETAARGSWRYVTS